jgi:hypothetical protein
MSFTHYAENETEDRWSTPARHFHDALSTNERAVDLARGDRAATPLRAVAVVLSPAESRRKAAPAPAVRGAQPATRLFKRVPPMYSRLAF